MSRLTVCICTYNRAERLPSLINALRVQDCPIAFEILVVDSNSTDNTHHIIQQLSSGNRPPLRHVIEPVQGVSFARNRAIKECIDSDYILFLDDDEYPLPGLLQTAVRTLENEKAECVGGRIKVSFEHRKRPSWLGDDLLRFLGEVDYGNEPFWIKNSLTPIWTGNIAYRMAIFRNNSDIRFNPKYTCKERGIGYGEYAIMFYDFLRRGIKMRYHPGMVVERFVKERKLKRSYFLKLQYIVGRRNGQYDTDEYLRTIMGIPPFMLINTMRQCGKTLKLVFQKDPSLMRQAMNASYAAGRIQGRFLRWQNLRDNRTIFPHDIGRIDEHSDYVRFIIVGHARTGSNFLRGLLNSHSRIIALGEIFRNFPPDSIGWDTPGYPHSRSVLSLFQKDPIKFLEEKVFRNFPKHISAVGFKIFYYHAQNENWKPVWTYLRNQEDLRIIHIKRKNFLKTHFSLIKAFKTNEWGNTSGAQKENVSISLSYEDCLKSFIKMQEWEKKYDIFFENNYKIDVLYENLSNDYENEMKRIQEFLGVDYEVVTPSTYKQSNQPLSKAISNYFELKEKFKGTPWEEFFED